MLRVARCKKSIIFMVIVVRVRALIFQHGVRKHVCRTFSQYSDLEESIAVNDPKRAASLLCHSLGLKDESLLLAASQSSKLFRALFEKKLPQRSTLEVIERGERRRMEMKRAHNKLGGEWSRIEALDASHFGGSDPAVAYVSLLNGAPFGERSWRLSEEVTPGDDIRSLAFATKERFFGDTGNNVDYPDVLVVDGGKAQLKAVRDIVKDLSPPIRLLALAKGNRGSVEERRNGEKLICGSTDEVLAIGDDIPLLVRLARDLAHSAAIRSHRRLRQARLSDEDVSELEAASPKKKTQTKKIAMDTLELERFRRLVDRVVLGNEPPKKDFVRQQAGLSHRAMIASDSAIRAEVRSVREQFMKTGACLEPNSSGSTYKLETPWRDATQPQREAIDAVLNRLDDPESGGLAAMKGVTGSGKTFCMASIIAQRQIPALVIAPNKVLAAQLYDELRGMFSSNAVCFFVSYYDYFRPEFLNTNSDTYKSKRSSINKELDRLRHQATAALASGRQDVIVVASVSCLYGLGVPATYYTHAVRIGDDLLDVDSLLSHRLGFRLAEPDESEEYPPRGHFTFNAEADEMLVTPADDSEVLTYKIKFDEAQCVSETYCILRDQSAPKVSVLVNEVRLLPATHFSQASSTEARERVTREIERELGTRIAELNAQGKFDLAERLHFRTMNDIDKILRTGKCPGIENYSRHLVGSAPGEAPITLLDYFPARTNTSRFLVIVDESHLALTQISSCSAADSSRKRELVANGYRLPSAIDNRPLSRNEFWERVPEAVLVSATPGKHEAKLLSERSSSERCESLAAELLVRPTHICDPQILVRGTENQIDDAILEAKVRAARDERTIIVALSVAEAKAIADRCNEAGLRTAALTGGIKPGERLRILQNFQNGELDAIVGIQLLREGIDVHQCSLVCVIDSDKEGFLRTDVALTQVIGRAARHIHGTAILYGDRITPAMQRCIDETDRRRSVQLAYNLQHNIDPSPHAAKSAKRKQSIFDTLGASSAVSSSTLNTPSSGLSGLVLDDDISVYDSSSLSSREGRLVAAPSSISP